jgi:hypothetical protein
VPEPSTAIAVNLVFGLVFGVLKALTGALIAQAEAAK